MSNISANLEALGEPRRRKLFELLVDHPASVGELAKQAPDVTRSAISQHLRVLVDARLIRYQTVGSRNIYQVDADGLTVLRNYFDSLWGHALRDLKSLAEESHLKKKHQTPHRSIVASASSRAATLTCHRSIKRPVSISTFSTFQ